MLVEHTLYFDTVHEARQAEIALMQTTIDCCNLRIEEAGEFPSLTFGTGYELDADARIVLEDIAQSICGEFNVMPAWGNVFADVPMIPGTERLRRQHRGNGFALLRMALLELAETPIQFGKDSLSVREIADLVVHCPFVVGTLCGFLCLAWLAPGLALLLGLGLWLTILLLFGRDQWE